MPDGVCKAEATMEPGFQAVVDCMLEAGWTRGEIMRSLRRLIAADNMAQKENASSRRTCVHTSDDARRSIVLILLAKILHRDMRQVFSPRMGLISPEMATSRILATS
jgi:hypothetical protein